MFNLELPWRDAKGADSAATYRMNFHGQVGMYRSDSQVPRSASDALNADGSRSCVGLFSG
jgi:hypothetical protein